MRVIPRPKSLPYDLIPATQLARRYDWVVEEAPLVKGLRESRKDEL